MAQHDAASTVGEAVAKRLVWRKTADPDHPWQVMVDGHVWKIRLGDYPAEVLYTLLIDGNEIGVFDRWPRATWTRPDDQRRGS